MSLSGDSNSKKRKYDPENVDYVSRSEVELDTFSFLWSIHNFSGLADNVKFGSPIHRGGPKTNHSWQLYVRPIASNTEDPNAKEKGLSVFLALTEISGLEAEDQKKTVKASYEVCFFDTAGEPGKYAARKYEEPHEYTEGQYSEYTGCADITSLKAIEVLNDVLTIYCRVWIYLGFEHTTVPGGRRLVPLTEEASKVQILQQLGLDLKQGFETGAFTDLSLVTKTKTFKTHKFMLSARSPVFKSMFSLQKANRNSVKIQDFDEETVESMLRFIYSGETTALSADQACDLLRMAENYEVLGLKEHLEEVLCNKLDTSNVLKVLAIADMHGASKLKTAALRFTNKFKEILEQTAAFKELFDANPNLLKQLYALLRHSK